jgi:hypothetical protein
LSVEDALTRARGLGLRPLPERGGRGYWLAAADADVAPDRLYRLFRQRGLEGDWRGLVLMKPELHPDEIFLRQLHEWGDAGLYAPPFVFFGDPVWIARLRKAFADVRADCACEDAPHHPGVDILRPAGRGLRRTLQGARAGLAP